MDFILYILIFWIGWLCSSLWNYFLNLGMAAMMMRHVTYSVACFMKIMHDASLEFLNIKYTGLRENSIPENTIKSLRMADEQMIRETQRTLLDLMIEKYPKGFSRLLRFKNWHEMKQYINEHQKES